MRGNIYLIFDEENERYKIGITKNSVDKRLKNLQTGNSSILTVKGTYTTDYMYRMETLIHNHFRHCRIVNYPQAEDLWACHEVSGLRTIG